MAICNNLFLGVTVNNIGDLDYTLVEQSRLSTGSVQAEKNFNAKFILF